MGTETEILKENHIEIKRYARAEKSPVFDRHFFCRTSGGGYIRHRRFMIHDNRMIGSGRGTHFMFPDEISYNQQDSGNEPGDRACKPHSPVAKRL